MVWNAIKRIASKCFSANVAFLLAWCVCVIAMTLFPFNFQMPPNVHTRLYQYSLRGFEDLPDVVLNLLFFIPLGALLQREGRRRAWRPILTLALAGAAGFLLSSSVEYLQVFLPTRDSSLIDVMTNTTGALIGVYVYRIWETAGVPRAVKLRTRMSSGTLVRMLVGYSVLALVVSGVLQARTRLSNWSVDYPLLIGNEKTGDRPWHGRVLKLEVTDAATNLELLREFARGHSLTMPGQPVATFGCTGRPPYGDASGHLPVLGWTQRPSDPDPHLLRLSGSAWLSTERPATEMVRQIQASNAFTLYIVCGTADANQGGPARIVSNSLDPYYRNFTLGQQDGNMVFRLRTPSTGLDGTSPQLVVPNIFSTDQLRDIVVSYDGATLLVAVRNIHKVYRMQLNPGSSLLGHFVSKTPDVQLYGLGYYASLFIFPGVLLGALVRTFRQWLEIAIPWMVAFTIMLEAVLVMASGRPFDWNNVAVSAGIGAIVLIVVSVAFSEDFSQNSIIHIKKGEESRA